MEIEFDKTEPFQDNEGFWHFKKPDVKVYYIPDEWKPVFGEFNKPYCYLLQHHKVFKKGTYEISAQDVSVWIKTRELVDDFLKEHNIKAYRKSPSKDGWLIDRI